MYKQLIYSVVTERGKKARRVTNLLCDTYSDQRTTELESWGGNGLQVSSFTLVCEEAAGHVRFASWYMSRRNERLGFPLKNYAREAINIVLKSRLAHQCAFLLKTVGPIAIPMLFSSHKTVTETIVLVVTRYVTSTVTLANTVEFCSVVVQFGQQGEGTQSANFANVISYRIVREPLFALCTPIPVCCT